MTAPRVVMVAPTPFFSHRGCHVRILEEARALAALGVGVTLCTYFLGDTPEGVRVLRGRRVAGYAKRSAGPSWTKPFLDLDLRSLTARAVREVQPHILHAHLHEGMAIAAMIPFSGPRVLDYQGSLTHELLDHGMPRWTGPAWRRIESWINGRADHILASHAQAVEQLQDGFGIPAGRVTVTEDAGTLPPANPDRVRELRDAWGLSPGVPVLLYTGLLGGHQGTDHLLGLAAALREQGLSGRVLACGYPREPWEKAARSRGLEDHIRFTGEFPYADYPNILALGDVALSPKTSLTEGNQKLYAYLQAGLPVVAFDTPVNRAILGEAGVWADREHPESFTRGALELLSDTEQRERARRASEERARTSGGWADVGRRIVEAYRILAPEAF